MKHTFFSHKLLPQSKQFLWQNPGLTNPSMAFSNLPPPPFKRSFKAVERLPALHYSVDFIFFSFGIMSFIVELLNYKRVTDEA